MRRAAPRGIYTLYSPPTQRGTENFVRYSFAGARARRAPIMQLLPYLLVLLSSMLASPAIITRQRNLRCR